MGNDFEKIFYQDVRNKKRTASGIHHRASRRGYIKGGVKTQSDFMTKKEKEKLNGEVKVYNMYDKYNVITNVPSLNEIERMDINDRVNLYRFLKNRYSNVVLQKHWGISAGSLYNKVYEKYNLYTPRTVNSKVKNGIYNNDITNVPSLEEILEMPTNRAKGILVAVKEEFTGLALINHWNISKATLYKYYRQFGIVGNNKDLNNVEQLKIDAIQNNENIKTEDIKVENITPDNINTENVQDETKQKMPSLETIIKTLTSKNINKSTKEVEKQMSNKNGFTIQLNGEYSKESLENKLLAINNILEENSKYRITLSLEEI